MIAATGVIAVYEASDGKGGTVERIRPVVCWDRDEDGRVVGMVQWFGHAELVPADRVGLGAFQHYGPDRSQPVAMTPAVNPSVAVFKEWTAPVEFWALSSDGN